MMLFISCLVNLIELPAINQSKTPLPLRVREIWKRTNWLRLFAPWRRLWTLFCSTSRGVWRRHPSRAKAIFRIEDHHAIITIYKAILKKRGVSSTVSVRFRASAPDKANFLSFITGLAYSRAQWCSGPMRGRHRSSRARLLRPAYAPACVRARIGPSRAAAAKAAEPGTAFTPG